jgi:hypothetical protein
MSFPTKARVRQFLPFTSIDYALKPRLSLRVGYVSLNFDYSASSLPIGFDVRIKGPILLTSFRF